MCFVMYYTRLSNITMLQPGNRSWYWKKEKERKKTHGDSVDFKKLILYVRLIPTYKIHAAKVFDY